MDWAARLFRVPSPLRVTTLLLNSLMTAIAVLPADDDVLPPGRAVAGARSNTFSTKACVPEGVWAGPVARDLARLWCGVTPLHLPDLGELVGGDGAAEEVPLG